MQCQYDLETQLHYTIKAFNTINNSSIENPHKCNFSDAYMDFLITDITKKFKKETKIHVIANSLGCYDAADYFLELKEFKESK